MLKTLRVLVVLVVFLTAALAQLGSFSFAKVVTTAGTRVALSSTALAVRSYLVIAKPANTGYIYVGGSNVSSSNGNRLSAGGGEGWLPLGNGANREDFYDLSKVYIDSSVNGEGVIVRYVR